MIFRPSKAFLLLILLSFTQAAFAWKMEAGKITVNDTTGNTSTHINFKQSYNTPPLVFTLTKSTGTAPAALRVNNITTTGFDIYSVEPEGENGPHNKMTTVPYIAIDAGSHVFPDGTRIVAGSVNTTQFQSKSLGGTGWQAISLSAFSTTPVVLGEIQTRSNERTDLSVPSAVSQPWMTTAIDNISSSGFDIALERSEVASGTISSSEKIAYLAIDSGLNSGGHYFGSNTGIKVEYESIRTGTIITGWDDSTSGVTVNFSKTYSDPVVVATKNSRTEADGGWFRRKSISDSSIALKVDEDKALDNERNHIGQVAGILLFSEPFAANFAALNQTAEMIINEVLYKEAVTGINNEEFVEFYVTSAGDVQGTIVTDQDKHFYRFPSQYVSIGDYVVYHTGAGTNSSGGGVHHFYQGISNIWNNPGEDILLLKPAVDDVTVTNDGKAFNATVEDYIAYGSSSTGGAVDPVPTSLNGTTVSWNSAYTAELLGAAAGESISLTPNASDSNKAACWELTTSGNASDNGCAGYLITQDTDTSSFITSEAKNNNALVKIILSKKLLTIYDPYNGASNPKAIPSSVLEYIINASNNGDLAADNNTIKISDFIPTNTKLCVTDTGNCKAPYFIDGTPSSGLSVKSR